MPRASFRRQPFFAIRVAVASPYLATLLASEGLGKAILLRLATPKGREKWLSWSWAQWWDTFYDHLDKRALTALLHAQVKAMPETLALYQRLDAWARHGGEEMRERTMYVDFNGDTFIGPPRDDNPGLKQSLKEEVEFCEWLLKELAPNDGPG